MKEDSTVAREGPARDARARARRRRRGDRGGPETQGRARRGLAVGDAKLRSAERLCSKLRGDGDRKSAAIDTLELRIADADARRDAAEARVVEAERLMKEEAQRAERLAEAAKDADAGLAQQLEAETARRGRPSRARVAALGLAAPPPVPPQEPCGAPSSTPPTSPRNPGPPADLGRFLGRGRRGGSLGRRGRPVQLGPRRRPARRARPSPGWSPAVLRRQEHVALPAPETPPPLALAALYGARAGAGGGRPSPTAPSPSRRRATTGRNGRPRVSYGRRRRRRPASATPWTRSAPPSCPGRRLRRRRRQPRRHLHQERTSRTPSPARRPLGARTAR